jgi:cell shape-determining protein MreC
MGPLTRTHIAAFGICLAAIVCPRRLWDRARLAVLGRLEPAAAAALAAAPGDRELALFAERIRAEAERADLERALADVTALREVTPAVRAEAIVPARVLGSEAGRAAAARGAAARGGGRVRIDAGRGAGLEEGLAVAAGARLVGQVAAAGGAAAEVELVTSPRFRARCRNARTGVEGIVRGAGDGTLTFRPDGAATDLATGDAVVTSAWSGFAPPNLVIGVVDAIARDPDTGLPLARVQPAADAGRIERVLVIRREGGPESAP